MSSIALIQAVPLLPTFHTIYRLSPRDKGSTVEMSLVSTIDTSQMLLLTSYNRIRACQAFPSRVSTSLTKKAVSVESFAF